MQTTSEMHFKLHLPMRFFPDQHANMLQGQPGFPSVPKQSFKIAVNAII
jgi:hypothetical protein